MGIDDNIMKSRSWKLFSHQKSLHNFSILILGSNLSVSDPTSSKLFGGQNLRMVSGQEALVERSFGD